jgi:hypothetical protein
MVSNIDSCINKWNWGSFLLGPIWGIGNSVLFGVCAWIPIVTLFITIVAQVFVFPPIFFLSLFLERIYFFGFPVFYIFIALVLGLRGSRWSWETGKWKNIEEFRKSQRIWFWVGVVLTVPLNILTFKLTYYLIYWSIHIFDAV